MRISRTSGLEWKGSDGYKRYLKDLMIKCWRWREREIPLKFD